MPPPAAGFHAATLTSSKLNPALNPASPTKGHNITRSVSVLSNLSVYCGVKQGIYRLNLFKGFETAALVTYHPGLRIYIPTIWSLDMKMYRDKNLVGLSICKNV